MRSTKYTLVLMCLCVILIRGALTQNWGMNKFRTQRGNAPLGTAVGSNKPITHSSVGHRQNPSQSDKNNDFHRSGGLGTVQSNQHGNDFGVSFNNGLNVLLSSYKDGHIGSVPAGGYLEVPTLNEINSPTAYRPNFMHDKTNNIIKNTRGGQNILQSKQGHIPRRRNLNRIGNQFAARRHQNNNGNNVAFSVKNENQFDRRRNGFDNRRKEQMDWRNHGAHGNTKSRNEHRSQNMINSFRRKDGNVPLLRAVAGRKNVDMTRFHNNAVTRNLFGGAPVFRRHSRVFNNQI